MVPTKRHHVESVWATVELIKEITVGVLRCVVNLQLTAWIVFLCTVSIWNCDNLDDFILLIISFLQDVSEGFMVAVTRTSGFGLLYFMTVDPTPQFMSQLHALGPVNRRLAGGRRSEKGGTFNNNQRLIL